MNTDLPIFIDITSPDRPLIAGISNVASAPGPTLYSGSPRRISICFVTPPTSRSGTGTVETTGLTLTLSAKRARSSTTALFTCSSFTQEGSGSATRYVGILDTSVPAGTFADADQFSIIFELELKDEETTPITRIPFQFGGTLIKKIIGDSTGDPSGTYLTEADATARYLSFLDEQNLTNPQLTQLAANAGTTTPTASRLAVRDSLARLYAAAAILGSHADHTIKVKGLDHGTLVVSVVGTTDQYTFDEESFPPAGIAAGQYLWGAFPDGTTVLSIDGGIITTSAGLLTSGTSTAFVTATNLDPRPSLTLYRQGTPVFTIDHTGAITAASLTLNGPLVADTLTLSGLIAASGGLTIYSPDGTTPQATLDADGLKPIAFRAADSSSGIALYDANGNLVANLATGTIDDDSVHFPFTGSGSFLKGLTIGDNFNYISPTGTSLFFGPISVYSGDQAVIHSATDITGYDSSGNPTFALYSATGAATFAGEVWFGSWSGTGRGWRISGGILQGYNDSSAALIQFDPTTGTGYLSALVLGTYSLALNGNVSFGATGRTLAATATAAAARAALSLDTGNSPTFTGLTLTTLSLGGFPITPGTFGRTLLTSADSFTARSSLGLSRMTPIHGGDGSWVTPTAISGTVGTNTYFGGTRTGQIVTATAGFGRFYYNAANSSNPYTGSRTTVNWSLPFRISFRAQIYVNANASSKVTILFATGTGTVAHDLAAVGLALQAYGNGTSTFIRLQSHSGSASSNGTAVPITPADDTYYDFELVWTPGAGGSAVLYRDDSSLCSVSTTLATGSGASGATCFMGLFENGSGSSDATTLRLMYFTPRRG